jgi:hypothetical protein
MNEFFECIGAGRPRLLMQGRQFTVLEHRTYETGDLGWGLVERSYLSALKSVYDPNLKHGQVKIFHQAISASQYLEPGNGTQQETSGKGVKKHEETQ